MLNIKLKIIHIDVKNQIFIVTIPPYLSIPLQSGDRMEEQLPSSERAVQGEEKQTEHLKLHFYITFP